MFEKFSEKAIKVIMLAQEEARRLGHNFVGTEQILLGLIGEETGVAAKVLKPMGVNLKDARIEVEKIIGRGSGFVAVAIPFTPRAKRMLELSMEEARQLGHNYIGTEHLLLGLIREGKGVATRVLDIFGVDLKRVRENVLLALKDPGILEQLENNKREEPGILAGAENNQRLERFQKRNKIFQLLARLPSPQFNQVVFGLEVPPGNVPPSSSPQADRVIALVEWATSPIGCGLEHLEEVLQLVITSKY